MNTTVNDKNEMQYEQHKDADYSVSQEVRDEVNKLLTRLGELTDENKMNSLILVCLGQETTKTDEGFDTTHECQIGKRINPMSAPREMLLAAAVIGSRDDDAKMGGLLALGSMMSMLRAAEKINEKA